MTRRGRMTAELVARAKALDPAEKVRLRVAERMAWQALEDARRLSTGHTPTERGVTLMALPEEHREWWAARLPQLEEAWQAAHTAAQQAGAFVESLDGIHRGAGQ